MKEREISIRVLCSKEQEEFLCTKMVEVAKEKATAQSRKKDREKETSRHALGNKEQEKIMCTKTTEVA